MAAALRAALAHPRTLEVRIVNPGGTTEATIHVSVDWEPAEIFRRMMQEVDTSPETEPILLVGLRRLDPFNAQEAIATQGTDSVRVTILRQIPSVQLLQELREIRVRPGAAQAIEYEGEGVVDAAAFSDEPAWQGRPLTEDAFYGGKLSLRFYVLNNINMVFPEFPPDVCLRSILLGLRVMRLFLAYGASPFATMPLPEVEAALGRWQANEGNSQFQSQFVREGRSEALRIEFSHPSAYFQNTHFKVTLRRRGFLDFRAEFHRLGQVCWELSENSSNEDTHRLLLYFLNETLPRLSGGLILGERT
jgi:hypothetical protein